MRAVKTQDLTLFVSCRPRRMLIEGAVLRGIELNLDEKNLLAIFRAIKKPELRKFIDVPSFYRSREFDELLEVICAHAVVTGDTGRLQEMLIFFDHSKFFEDVASRIKVRTGLLVSRELKGFKFFSSTHKNTKVSVDLLARKKPPLSVRDAAKGGKKWGKGDIDALDHWSRLPGSYGTGKRP